MTFAVRQFERLIRESLSQTGIEDSEARSECDLILAHTTGWTLAQRMMDPERPLTEDARVQIEKILAQRRNGTPLQYCLGEAWFMGHRFIVRSGVFIPRADTETLVETVLNRLNGISSPLIAEVGTGSGAISLSILAARPDARAVATEISAIAHQTTLENAQNLSVIDRLSLSHGDWQQWLTSLSNECDAFVSNPPYIPKYQESELAREVLNEPYIALFGKDEDGLGFYRDFARLAGRCLKIGGFAAVETGDGQGDPVVEIFHSAGWQNPLTVFDLSGHKRVVVASGGNLGTINAS